MNCDRGDQLTVAKVMANAALFEQMLMSGSTAMIFLTLDTVWPGQYILDTPVDFDVRNLTCMAAEPDLSPPSSDVSVWCCKAF